MFVLFNYGIFHESVSSRDYIGPDGKVTIRRVLEGSGRGLSEIISRRLPGHAEDDYEYRYILSIPQSRIELNASRLTFRSIIA
jgi:hypothetical protein